MSQITIRHTRQSLAARLAVLSLLLVACTTVKFAADYDPIMDQTVTELQASTASFFAKMQAAVPVDSSFYNENKDFFDRSRGIISTLAVRAEVLEQDLPLAPLTENFQTLQEQFDELEKGVKPDAGGTVRLRTTPLIQSSREAFNQSFRAIITHMVFLKKKVE